MCTSSLKRVIMQYRWWDSHCYIQVSKKITSCVVLHVFDFSSNSCRRKTDTSQSRRNMNLGLRGWLVAGEVPSAWHRYKLVQQIWVKWLGPSILGLSTSALLFEVWDLDSIWSVVHPAARDKWALKFKPTSLSVKPIRVVHSTDQPEEEYDNQS
jgi:predicted cupin superfamily sugar epimerase